MSPDERDRCPQCGGQVQVEPICPGYPDTRDGKKVWVQCYPACGNAALWECANIACGWWFIDGMNRHNKLFTDNESRRPWWLAKCGKEVGS